jgi:hypothetical protein
MSTPVTPETFIRAETDRYFALSVAMNGGVNRLFHYRGLVPLDQQSVVRMNRDVLYSVGIADTEGGATITVPEMPDSRYVSVYIADNDHYVPAVIYEPGEHRLPQDTRFLAVGVRIQVFDPADADEVRLINALQDKFAITASSSGPFTAPEWDQESLSTLRRKYEAEFSTYDRYPDGWQGRRGEVDESTRHLAAAGAWGLFPNRDAFYINHNPGLPATGPYQATYDIPENDAFWSITVYGDDGYMKSDTCILNAANVALDDDGRFTARFGSAEAWGPTPNRLDISPGWNFLMRVYRPGRSVLDGAYTLPAVQPVRRP